MLSTFLELLGFAAFVAATYIVAGPAGALYVGGVSLLLVGYAVNDDATAAVLTRATAPVRARIQSLRTRRVQKKGS